ncbi:MAG: hypothetical protein ACTH8J_03040 [Specibacter sp.]
MLTLPVTGSVTGSIAGALAGMSDAGASVGSAAAVFAVLGGADGAGGLDATDGAALALLPAAPALAAGGAGSPPKLVVAATHQKPTTIRVTATASIKNPIQRARRREWSRWCGMSSFWAFSVDGQERRVGIAAMVRA